MYGLKPCEGTDWMAANGGRCAVVAASNCIAPEAKPDCQHREGCKNDIFETLIHKPPSEVYENSASAGKIQGAETKNKVPIDGFRDHACCHALSHLTQIRQALISPQERRVQILTLHG